SIAPYFVLVAVRGAFALAELVAQRRGKPDAHPAGDGLATLAMMLLIILSLASLVRVEYRLPKQAFVEAQRWVEGARRPGDRIATGDITTLVYHGYFSGGWDSGARA